MKKTEDQKKAKAEETKAKEPKVEERGYFYLDEKVKDFIYSDYVRVNSSIRGMLFSFGKVHPESDKCAIINEVFLPLDVAFSLKKIIEDQLNKHAEDGVIELRKEDDAAAK